MTPSPNAKAGCAINPVMAAVMAKAKGDLLVPTLNFLLLGCMAAPAEKRSKVRQNDYIRYSSVISDLARHVYNPKMPFVNNNEDDVGSIVMIHMPL